MIVIADYFNLPILITVTRLAVTPFIVFALLYKYWLSAALLFAVAAVTDFLDGFLARLLNQQTKLGALLDPLADKVLLISCYAVFALLNTSCCRIPYWFLIFVTLKECLLIAGALYMNSKQSIHIRPTLLGKATMVVQLFFIGCLFVSNLTILDAQAKIWLSVLLWLVSGFVLLSLMQYTYLAYKDRS